MTTTRAVHCAPASVRVHPRTVTSVRISHYEVGLPDTTVWVCARHLTEYGSPSLFGGHAITRLETR